MLVSRSRRGRLAFDVPLRVPEASAEATIAHAIALHGHARHRAPVVSGIE